MKKELIEDLATRLRRLLENNRTSNDLNYSALETFPKTCCSITSYILGTLLWERGCHNLFLVNSTGLLEDYGTVGHHWIEISNLIVDITADQFEGEDSSPVIVSEQSDLHEKLRKYKFSKQKIESDYLISDNGCFGLKDVYIQIKAKL